MREYMELLVNEGNLQLGEQLVEQCVIAKMREYDGMVSPKPASGMYSLHNTAVFSWLCSPLPWMNKNGAAGKKYSGRSNGNGIPDLGGSHGEEGNLCPPHPAGILERLSGRLFRRRAAYAVLLPPPRQRAILPYEHVP